MASYRLNNIPILMDRVVELVKSGCFRNLNEQYLVRSDCGALFNKDTEVYLTWEADEELNEVTTKPYLVVRSTFQRYNFKVCLLGKIPKHDVLLMYF